MFCTLLSGVDIWGVKIVVDVLLIGDTKADETAVPPISKTIDNPLFIMICCGYAMPLPLSSRRKSVKMTNGKKTY